MGLEPLVMDSCTYCANNDFSVSSISDSVTNDDLNGSLGKPPAPLHAFNDSAHSVSDEQGHLNGNEVRRLACATPAYDETCARPSHQGSNHATLIGMSAMFLLFMVFARRWFAKRF